MTSKLIVYMLITVTKMPNHTCLTVQNRTQPVTHPQTDCDTASISPHKYNGVIKNGHRLMHRLALHH
jgi:hypothetical protein